MLSAPRLVLGLLLSSVSFAQTDLNIGCLTQPDGWASMHKQALVLRLGGEQSITLPVRIADERHERSAGYQWICPEQAENTAMLFTFDGMIDTAFHMRNVYVPLNILFFDAQGKLVDKLWMAAEANTASKGQYYRPSGSFKYALEITESFTSSRLQNSPQLSIDIAASNLH